MAFIGSAQDINSSARTGSRRHTSVGDDRVDATMLHLNLFRKLRITLCVSRYILDDSNAPGIFLTELLQRRRLRDIAHSGVYKCVRVRCDDMRNQSKTYVK